MRSVPVAFGALLVLFGALSFRYPFFHERSLPEQIGPVRQVDSGSNVGWWDIGVAREGCGAIIYEMTEEAAGAMKREGLPFFEHAQEGSKFPSDRSYSYGPWRETPGDVLFGDSLVSLGLSCMKADNDIVRQIAEAAGRSGSFYTRSHETQLLVLPSLRLVVFGYFG